MPFFMVKKCTITLDKIQTVVRSKEFSNVKYLRIDDSGEGLSVSRTGREHIRMSKSNRFDSQR